MITFVKSHEDAEAVHFVPATGDPDRFTITGWFRSRTDHSVRLYELYVNGRYVTGSPSLISLEMMVSDRPTTVRPS